MAEKWGMLTLWAVVFILSVVFMQERLFADASYYFFHSINQGYPQVDHQRFVLAISEMLPLVGSYLGLPMKSLVGLYSIGHVLFAFILFQQVYLKHGSVGHGLMIQLLQFTGFSILWFSPMLEFWYGLILLVYLDHRLYTQKTAGIKNVALIAALSITILFSHPENFIGFLFVVMYRWLDGKIPLKWIGAAVGLMAVVAAFKFLTFSDYEAGKVGKAGKISSGGPFDMFEIPYLIKLAKMLMEHYYDCLIYLILGVVILFKRKSFLKAGSLGVFSLGFIIFINVALQRNEFSRHTESFYLPLTFLCLYSVCMVWPLIQPKLKIVLAGLMIVFSGIRIADIIEIGNNLKLRSVQMDEFVNIARAEHSRKMILKTANITTEFSHIGWSYPIETLVVSAMDGPSQCVSIILDEDLGYGENDSLSTSENFLLRRWEMFRNVEVNQQYFQLPEAEYSWSDLKR